MNPRVALPSLLTVGLLLGSAAPAAWATFVEQAVAEASFTADVLAPPTGVAAAPPACVAGGYQTEVSWTASSSSWLDGYEVAISTEPGGPYDVLPRPAGVSPTATTRTVSGLARKTTYYVVVRTTRSAWRSQSDQVAMTTPSRNC